MSLLERIARRVFGPPACPTCGTRHWRGGVHTFQRPPGPRPVASIPPDPPAGRRSGYEFTEEHVTTEAELRDLSSALINSGLVASLRDYAREAHPDTMADESLEEIARGWAPLILARLGVWPPNRPTSNAGRAIFDDPELHGEDCTAIRWPDPDGDPFFDGTPCDCACAAFVKAEAEAVAAVITQSRQAP